VTRSWRLFPDVYVPADREPDAIDAEFEEVKDDKKSA